MADIATRIADAKKRAEGLKSQIASQRDGKNDGGMSDAVSGASMKAVSRCKLELCVVSPPFLNRQSCRLGHSPSAAVF